MSDALARTLRCVQGSSVFCEGRPQGRLSDALTLLRMHASFFWNGSDGCLVATRSTRPLWHDFGMVLMVTWPLLTATWTGRISTCLTPRVCAGLRCYFSATLRTGFGKTICTHPLWHAFGMVPSVVWPVLTTTWTRWIGACLTPRVCACFRCNCSATLRTRFGKTICTHPLWHDFGMIPTVVGPFLATTWTRWMGARLTPCVCACLGCNSLAAPRARFGKTICTRPFWHDLGMVSTVVRPVLSTTWTGGISLLRTAS